MYDLDLRPLFRYIGIILICLFIWGTFAGYKVFFGRKTIESDKPIIPELKLVIKDNKVDTVYVYKNN